MRSLITTLMLTLCVSTASAQMSPDMRKQVRSDCRVDALHHCPKESARCLWREDKGCTDAIIACMSANKTKLKPACARWVW